MCSSLLFSQENNFELSYQTYCSVGICRSITYPTVKIHDDSLFYTYGRDSSKWDYNWTDMRWEPPIDSDWIKSTVTRYVGFRKSSTDSILKIISGLHDTTLDDYYDRPFTVGGFCAQTINIHYLDNLELNLTVFYWDSTITYHIYKILNTYLPQSLKIRLSYDAWKEDKAYWKREKENLYKKEK